MLSLQRRNEIKMILLEKKSVTVSEISAYFGVSAETVRRDFEALEETGFLSKTYGGAVLQNKVARQVERQVLESLFVSEKKLIASQCVEFIRPGQCIFLDFSTTVYQLCSELQTQMMELTVMTNSHSVLSALAGVKRLSLLSTGGSFDMKTLSYFGRNAVRFLSSYHLDIAFVSCCSLSIEKGLSDRNEEEAEMRRCVIENANRVVLLADHTKFDRNSFIPTCDFERISALVTDLPVSDHWRAFLRQEKVALYECAAISGSDQTV